ncbi:HAD family hydrolase [Saccharothrix deserti]|uniref:HAD family hydrolase n=1 Tax=Saccharothrix deserti TaxID=2593674 RepID=UPI00131CE1DE|nr:HAD family phosphatase [Saccharothrix deserti]
MTTNHVVIDDPEALRRILATTDVLLLDFDGPVCAIFANVPAHYVADQLRNVLADSGHTTLPAEVEKTEDPFDVLTYAAALGTDEARYVEAALRAHEVEAAATAPPTPGAHDFIHAWQATGRKLAIVSNNSQAAVNTYLHRHNLTPLIHTVSARTNSDPTLLKPNAHLVDQAVASVNVRPSRCTLIGDSSSDISAGRATGTRTIGYANKPGKVATLSSPQAHAIVTSMKIPAAILNAADGEFR